ncbi:MAG: transcription-repair coupling factor [Planctomyces sp.]|jgi:transcription-repair coupling factor (superfamily II helicase)
MTGIREQGPASLADLASLIGSQPGFIEVIRALSSGNSAAIDGAWGSTCALSTAALAEATTLPLIVILPSIREAQEFADELSGQCSRKILLFPAWESIPGEQDLDDDIFAARLGTVRRIQNSSDSFVVVTCLPALLQPVPSESAIAAATRVLSVGDELDLSSLTDWLLERGFERVTAVELAGEFSIHGGIVDLFPPTESDPVRFELFGDEIESIRSFDVETQRRLTDLSSFAVTATTPAKQSHSAKQPDTTKQPKPQNAGADPGMGRSAFDEASETVSPVDYLPKSTIVVLKDMAQAVNEGRLYLQRLASPVGLYSVDATFSRLTDFASVTIDALGADSYETSCHLSVEPLERFSGSRHDALKELCELLAPEERVLLCCHNDAERQRLNELLTEAEESESLPLRHRVTLCTGRLDRGFRLISERLLVVSDHELFSRAQTRTVARKQRTADSRAIDTFLDLKDGDLVVHVSHGIARYRGITMVNSESQKEEHLVLEFRDHVVVYVPVSLIHLVQKYIGPAKSTPELSRFGGTAWTRKKEQVSEAIIDMASDMIRLQAERASKPGLRCEPDSHLQQEFERAFPYTETPDQVTAIADFKSDMESARPMDRLICGDVGFGKTEVAMRAVFKAIDNGRQAAVLVPTTILAEQHYRTFNQRMAEFPVNIEMLSRYRSPAEQKAIVEKVQAGEIDLIIGTHRLVSKDVKFRDLGLLVIDEEQKFGVKVKDRLKHLRTEVDVLTLTATPIPRTLHLSLLGIRDISSLTTPPRDRVPIETRVARFDESLIRSAVLRELNRGGQIYFVHNRVYDIEQLRDRLNRIVPEARITIAHGQMNEDELENAMMDFVTGRADLLLATTIIESGLDIPNANTMFIHQADIYGLADMHQLRGRVGRDRHRAYCYLLLEEGRTVTTKATRRLKAIEEYSELGAGFRIAMRDLEIRGAGNILGTEQSGNIAAVGYELYCQLLENAVRSAKKQPLRYQKHVKIELPVEAYLPDRFVSEPRQKIEIYRRLSQANRIAQITELDEELRDRFGPVPTPTRRMLNLRELNLRALSWKVENIHLQDGYAVLRYGDSRLIRMLAQLHRGSQKNGPLKIVDTHDAYWPLDSDERDGAAVLDELLKVFSIAEPPIPE